MSNIMTKLNKTKFIEAKAQGKNNTEAALIAGAANKQAAHKAGYRLNKVVDMQKTIDKALSKKGITLDNLLQVYVDALQAEQTDRLTGEISVNHTMRMKAADKLLDLSGIITQLKHQNPMSQNITTTDYKEIQGALKSGDEVELVKATFRKTE